MAPEGSNLVPDLHKDHTGCSTCRAILTYTVASLMKSFIALLT